MSTKSKIVTVDLATSIYRVSAYQQCIEEVEDWLEIGTKRADFIVEAVFGILARRSEEEAAEPEAPRTITTVVGLPSGSVVLAHWEDGSQPDYQMTRCTEGGASSSGFGVASGKHWDNMDNWGATLTLLHDGGTA